MESAAPKLLKLIDVSRHVGIPRRTLYDMIDSGRFTVPPVEGLKPRRWTVDSIDAWLRGVQS